MIYFNKPSPDELHFMRRLTRDAAWDIIACEERLQAAHKMVACAKALLLRGDYKFTLESVADEYGDDDNEPENAEEWVKHKVAYTFNNVKYWEEKLVTAHAVVAVIKAMLLRGNYTEINFDEIAAEMAKRYANDEGIGEPTT
jgi:hypothetical protein